MEANMYHETAPVIVFVCNKKRAPEMFSKSKLQIKQLKTSISVLGFTKYFLTSSALETLGPPNLCLLLRLSRKLDIFNISFSSSIIRLSALSPYQKNVQIGNGQNLGSRFIQQSCDCVVEINTAPQHV